MMRFGSRSTSRIFGKKKYSLMPLFFASNSKTYTATPLEEVLDELQIVDVTRLHPSTPSLIILF